jgi:hypothetical protein
MNESLMAYASPSSTGAVGGVDDVGDATAATAGARMGDFRRVASAFRARISRRRSWSSSYAHADATTEGDASTASAA